MKDEAFSEVLTEVKGVQLKQPARAQVPPANPVEGGNKRAGALWNQYGGAIAEQADKNQIPVGVALAVFMTEAGASAYDRDTGLVIIRFEQHLFNRQMGLSRARMRHDGQQLTEWNALQTAAAKDLEKAFRCTSFGLPQMMGFNCLSVGYQSAVDMALAFQDDVGNQVRGFFDFCRKGSLDRLIRKKDWQGFTRRYNGPGQVAHYSAVLESHLEIVRQMGFAV